MRLHLTLLLLGANALAEPGAVYLANAGVLVTRGETKIAFDPLAQQSYGQYQTLPREIRDGLINGVAPYDGIDAVLISHHHGDHFSPEDMLQLLREQTGMHLFAPAQAVSAMAALAGADEDGIFSRVTAIRLEYRQAPVSIAAGELLVEAVRIPHSGWPSSMNDVENIAFRVTLDEVTTVLHLGDADTSDVHFAQDPDFWDGRHTDLALPPYWYFLSASGRRVLAERLRPGHAIGVHVPEKMPDDPAARPPEFMGYDLFTEPGETRIIDASDVTSH